MIYLRLFTAFMKIGFTSFGGMSMIPVIMQEMKVNHWMTAEDLTNLIAIAEMTPGPVRLLPGCRRQMFWVGLQRLLAC